MRVSERSATTIITASPTREERRALRDRLVAEMPECEGLINYHVGQTLAIIGATRFKSMVATNPMRGANGRVLRAIAAGL